MKLYAPLSLLVIALLANGELCAEQYDGAPAAISQIPLFETTGNSSWPYSITLATSSDGESSQEEQTLDINITSLPLGAEYRVVKSLSNGNFFNGDPKTLSEGSRKITANAVEFDRTVKIQFSSGAITFDTLIVNAPYADITISIDDFAGLNTETNTNNLAISAAENGFGLILGPGSSIQGRDAFGTGTSKFGQTGEWFDGSYLKFGNSGNQQILDLRITNNTGADAKLKNISFDLRRANANYATDFQLLYLATGDSELIKGSSVADGTEMVNLVGIGSDSIVPGINNFSEFIGQNISGTAWIKDGGYANIRLKLNTTAPQAGSQLDNLVITCEVLDVMPPVFTSSPTATKIAENSGAGQEIYTATATDASGSEITYALQTVDDFDSFTLDAFTGVVTLTENPDNEAKSSYSFTVVATDSAGNQSELNITLDITDLDDNSPYFVSNSEASPVAPYSGANQVVYVAEAADEDESSALTYTLKEGDNAGSFKVNESTGEVTLLVEPDNANSPYTFTVIADDGVNDTVELEVTLQVSNDITKPVFSNTLGIITIEENSGVNQVVYTAAATDDSGVVSYSLKQVGDFASLTINESTGEVTLTEDPDYETQSSYNFVIVATDESGNSLELVITLEITDLNDSVPVFISSATADMIEENIGAGELIYTAVAIDNTGLVNFSLKQGEDSEFFTIDKSTGEVSLVEDPDYETQSSYTFIVLATNVFNNTTELTVTLEVSDLEEEWYSNSADLGNEWIRSDWLGDFSIIAYPWIYHSEHGWMYSFPSSTESDNIYFWDNSMNSVIWTSKDVYPLLYRFTDKSWIWYLKESKDPRRFVNLATSEWEESE